MRSLAIAASLALLAAGCGSSAEPEALPREDVTPVSTSVVLVTTTARPGPGIPSPWMASNTTVPTADGTDAPIAPGTTPENGEQGEDPQTEDYCTLAARAYDELDAFTAFDDPEALEAYMRGYLAHMDEAAEVVPLHLSFDYDLIRDDVRKLIADLEADGWQITSAFDLFDTTTAELSNAYDAIEDYERETCGI